MKLTEDYCTSWASLEIYYYYSLNVFNREKDYDFEKSTIDQQLARLLPT